MLFFNTNKESKKERKEKERKDMNKVEGEKLSHRFIQKH